MNSTMEKMNDKMPDMMGNQFYGKVSGEGKDKEKDRESMIIGVIKNQIEVLNEELEEADKKFSRAYRRIGKYEPCTFEANEECKLIESKIDLLEKLVNDIEYMLTPMRKSA